MAPLCLLLQRERCYDLVLRWPSRVVARQGSAWWSRSTVTASAPGHFARRCQFPQHSQKCTAFTSATTLVSRKLTAMLPHEPGKKGRHGVTGGRSGSQAPYPCARACLQTGGPSTPCQWLPGWYPPAHNCMNYAVRTPAKVHCATTNNQLQPGARCSVMGIQITAHTFDMWCRTLAPRSSRSIATAVCPVNVGRAQT